MHWEVLRDNVEHIAGVVRNTADEENAEDKAFHEIASMVVLTVGQTFISMAESLHDIAAVAKNWQDDRREPGEGPSLKQTGPALQPLPAAFDHVPGS